MWIALTVRPRLVTPSPVTICSFRTILMPSALTRTVFGAGLTGIVSGGRPSTAADDPTSVLVAVAVMLPHAPAVVADDWTMVAPMCRSLSAPTPTSMPSWVTVEAAATLLPVRRSDDALLVTRPAVSTLPVSDDDTFTEPTELVWEYAGGALPDALASGPLLTVTGEPRSGSTLSATDSPKAVLLALD